MTREERCWQKLCERLLRDPATSEESDTCTLRVALKHALAFADAEGAAMRERAAGVCAKYPASRIAADLASAIRALPATGEVGRG